MSKVKSTDTLKCSYMEHYLNSTYRIPYKYVIHVPDVKLLKKMNILSKISYSSFAKCYLEGNFETAPFKFFVGRSS